MVGGLDTVEQVVKHCLETTVSSADGERCCIEWLTLVVNPSQLNISKSPLD
jgi:hypothetical protein